MIDAILSLLAPHLCCGCGANGSLLCDNCKYNIISEPNSVCLACGRLCGASGLCNTCRVPYVRAWCVGERTDALQRLVGLYKFERAKATYGVLGDLLLEILPELPSDVIIVPVPTVRGHIRERGYDHTALLARYIAKKRHLRFMQPLARVTTTTQRRASAVERKTQAKSAFIAAGSIVKDVSYVLIDDIVTTGSTVKYAAQTLRDAGVSQVWVAVIARQTLD